MNRFTIGLGLVVALTSGAVTAQEKTQADVYEKLLDDGAAAVVTLRMVVRTEMTFGGRGNDRESREEVSGAVVDATGLILCGYDSFRSFEAEGMSLKRTPLEIKVVFGREEKEYDAELVATDQNLSLAFVKIKDLEGRVPPIVNFEGGAKAELGEQIHQVNRLDKGYDYAPFVRNGVVCGKLKKPRKALLIDGSIRGAGLPVYNEQGEVVGALTQLESGMKQDQGPSFGGGGVPAVIDAKVVMKTIELAARQAADMAKEAEEARAKEAAEGETKKEGETKNEETQGGG